MQSTFMSFQRSLWRGILSSCESPISVLKQFRTDIGDRFHSKREKLEVKRESWWVSSNSHTWQSKLHEILRFESTPHWLSALYSRPTGSEGLQPQLCQMKVPLQCPTQSSGQLKSRWCLPLLKQWRLPWQSLNCLLGHSSLSLKNSGSS